MATPHDACRAFKRLRLLKQHMYSIEYPYQWFSICTQLFILTRIIHSMQSFHALFYCAENSIHIVSLRLFNSIFMIRDILVTLNSCRRTHDSTISLNQALLSFAFCFVIFSKKRFQFYLLTLLFASFHVTFKYFIYFSSTQFQLQLRDI